MADNMLNASFYGASLSEGSLICPSARVNIEELRTQLTHAMIVGYCTGNSNNVCRDIGAYASITECDVP